jgi:hypothetical protein
MIIANPIYDTVFKRLMENRHVAKFFVETLIGEHVAEIAMVPQEYTYYAKAKKELIHDENRNVTVETEILSVIRFDFVATVCNANGEYKKVLIEIQKSNKSADLMRFRTYLGEQYKRIDMIEVSSGKVEKALPIITVYLLGFSIPAMEAAAIKVNRTYIDMIGQKEIRQKSEWIESLTHDGYFVQIPLVKGKPLTSLEKLLSVFEQGYFIDDKETTKDYEYPVDDENVRIIVELLRHAAADAKTRREMEEAWWAEQNEKEYERMEKEYVRMEKEYERMEKEMEAKDNMIEEKDKSLAEKEREIAELKRLLQ